MHQCLPFYSCFYCGGGGGAAAAAAAVATALGGGIFDLGAGMSLHVLWLEHEAQARPEARAASLWRLYWVPEKHIKTFSVVLQHNRVKRSR